MSRASRRVYTPELPWFYRACWKTRGASTWTYGEPREKKGAARVDLDAVFGTPGPHRGLVLRIQARNLGSARHLLVVGSATIDEDRCVGS